MSKRDGRKKVLFVCVGNACRSPMAEAIAHLDARDAMDAFSAGLMPIGFVPELTKQTLMKNGYWVEGLESKRISPGVWERVDVVINMSGRAKEAAFPECSKVIDWDIEDPFERDPEVYQRVFDEIRARIGELAEQFRREHAASRVAERRSRPRLYATSPMSMSLNGWSDARVVNISEDGLALSSDAALPSRPLQNLRIQFLGPSRPLEARCQIAWKSPSHKQAGIQFVDLTEEARRFIRNWISEQASCVGFQIQVDRTPKEQTLRLELPQTTPFQAGTTRANGAFEKLQREVLPAIASRTLSIARKSANARTKGTHAIRELGRKLDLVGAKLARAESKSGLSRTAWGEFAAVVIVTGVFTFILHGLATHRSTRTDVATVATPKLAASSEAAKQTISSLPTGTPGVADSAAQKVEPQSPIVDSPLPQKAEDAQHDGSEANPIRAAERGEHDASETSSSRAPARPAEKPSRSVLVKAASHSAESRRQRAQSSKQAGRFAAGTNVSPIKKRQPQTASALPIPPPLEVRIPEPVNLAPTRSPNARPARSEESASVSTPVKPQATAAQMAGEVSILAGPYPSLRADAGSSKKLREGANLQLGHLLLRVPPVYPEEAKRQGIQGTVKLRAVVDRYGSVKSLQSLDGPPILGAAVMKAVRQWQYTETRLAGQPVETEVDVAVVFRLSNPATPKS